MKRTLCIFTALVFTVITLGQTGKSDQPENDSIIPPQFSGSGAAWVGEDIHNIDDYLESFIRYPEGPGNKSHIGTAIVEFVVTTDGEVQDIKVINSVSEEIDREMIRVLNETDGLWKPGTMNGMPVPMKKEVSRTFAPDESFDLVSIARENLNKGNEALFVDEDPRSALRYYDEAVKILPYDKTLLSLRSLCKYELDDKKGAREDWERIINMEIGDATQLETGYLIKTKMRQLDGYKELNKMLEESSKEKRQ